MVLVNGTVGSYRVYISVKTPTGREIAENLIEDSRVNFTLEKYIKDGEESNVGEHFSLNVMKKLNDQVKLDTLPDYIKNDIPRNPDRVVLNVSSIETDAGGTIKEFTEEDADDKNNTATTGHQPELEYSGPPTRELLESITADAIESLGYEVASNTYRETTGGDSQEVDVWAEHPRTNFSMYASCKNWKSRVGRPTVQEEIGRIEDMKIAPQLRVLIVGTMTDEAETSVETNGFIPIILGEKANEENAKEIYQDVHSQLRETLLAIAPPDVENIANRADEISQDLRSLSKEIRNLESNMD